MYSRRTLLATLGTGILAGSFDVSAQQSARKTPRLGILLFNTPQIEPIGPLQEGLKAYGYEDGKTITIDYRFAEGKFERLPDLAADLVRLKPDVIFAYGGDVAPHAKKATSTIPIVAMTAEPEELPAIARAAGLTLSAVVDRRRAAASGFATLVDELLNSGVGGAELLYRLPDDRVVAAAAPDIVFVDSGVMRYLAENPSALHLLEPRQFEEVIAEIWRARGYDVELTPRTRDGGKDIYAVSSPLYGSLLYIIECKRNHPSRPVGVEIVRSLYGVAESEP